MFIFAVVRTVGSYNKRLQCEAKKLQGSVKLDDTSISVPVISKWIVLWKLQTRWQVSIATSYMFIIIIIT